MNIPGIETVPYREPAGSIPLIFTQHTCGNHDWQMGRAYDASAVAFRCRKCRLMMRAEVDDNGRVIEGAGETIYADAGVED